MLGGTFSLRHLICVGACLLSSACASTQLNYNTADLASSLNSLTKRQIFFNLSQAIDDPEFVPSQVTISIGVAQTANSVSPSISVPLGPSLYRLTLQPDLTRRMATSISRQVMGGRREYRHKRLRRKLWFSTFGKSVFAEALSEQAALLALAWQRMRLVRPRFPINCAYRFFTDACGHLGMNWLQGALERCQLLCAGRVDLYFASRSDPVERVVVFLLGNSVFVRGCFFHCPFKLAAHRRRQRLPEFLVGDDDIAEISMVGQCHVFLDGVHFFRVEGGMRIFRSVGGSACQRLISV